MRILFVTPAFPPFPGGGERYVRSLAFELVKQGHSVTAVTSTACLEKEFWEGTGNKEQVADDNSSFSVIRCPIRPMPGGRAGLMAWRKMMVVLSAVLRHAAVLRQMCRFIPPIQGLEAALQQLPATFDLVHGFNISWEYPLVAGWQFARKRRLPFVVTPFAHLGEIISPQRAQRAQRKGKTSASSVFSAVPSLNRVALNSTMVHQLQVLQDAERVLTLTSVEQDGLAAYGVRPERLAVIGGGLDPLPAETAVSPPYLPSPYALFIGRLSYDKGAIHAAQAISTLRAQEENIYLGLIGQNTPEFERFYQQLGKSEREGIRLLGVLTDAEKHALLEGAAMLLLPSHADSFGIVMLEAWAHGVPVIGARSGGIPGVVDEGENGLLVPFGDVPALSETIRQVLADENLRRRLGENGRTKVQTVYTWENVAERVIGVYRELLRR